MELTLAYDETKRSRLYLQEELSEVKAKRNEMIIQIKESGAQLDQQQKELARERSTSEVSKAKVQKLDKRLNIATEKLEKLGKDLEEAMYLII